MKRHLGIVMSLIALMTSANAYGFTVNYLSYKINADGNSVTVSKTIYTKYGDLTIPESVEYNSKTYSVTAIGSYAFSNCSGLTSVIIPNSVTAIGSSAFSDCNDLISVTIGNSVTEIGGSAFSSCSSLTSVTIPNSVTTIGYFAFASCTGLTSVTIGNSVTTIGQDAFEGCSSLTSVTIPNSVTTIGNGAFYGCNGLTEIDVENGNTKYDSRGECNAIIETASNTIIAGCKGSIIPNSVTEIGGSAFAGCTGLTSVTIPNSVTSIGGSAFSGCNGLTSVTIPNSVTTIGSFAFYGCSGLTSVTIPNSVTSIGIYAFQNCRGLTSLTIGNSVTSIGDQAFSNCSGLTSIKVVNGNPKYDSRNNCNAIIEIATNSLIVGCKTTTIPNSVTSIGSHAFGGCSGLTSVTIPNSVTTIGDFAFSCCTGLTSVTIPNSVTTIGDAAFMCCSGLTSVTIPNSVTSIGRDAFMDCTGLTIIVSHIVNPNDVALGSEVFYNVNKSQCVLAVPSGSVSLYEATDQWNSFKIKEEVLATAVNINKTSLCMAKGSTFVITATVLPSNATNKALNWTSSNTAVATVDQNGNVTTLSVGTTTIKATTTDGTGHSATCEVNVTVPVSSITLNQSSATINQSGTFMLTATVLPTNETNKTVYWSSSNTSVAYVDQNGVVTARAVGTATIWANTTDGTNLSASCNVTVVPDYTLSITPNVAHVRGNKKCISEVAVNMDNYRTPSGIQFLLTLPDGVSLAKDNDGYYDVWLDEGRKARNHTVQAESRGNNTYFVLISSPTNRTFSGNTGNIMHFKIEFEKYHSMAGTYNLKLSNIIIAEPNETQHSASNVQSALRLCYLVGDANADVMVNVADYVATANYLLGHDTGERFYTDAANAAYSDNTINVTDLVAITNIALELRAKEYRPSVEGFQLAPAATMPGEDYGVTADVTQRGGDRTVVSIAVNNDAPVAAMQFDLDMPDGVTLEAAEHGERAQGLSASVGTSLDGKARVIVSSFGTAAIESGNGEVLSLTLCGKAHEGELLRFDDVVMTERNLVEHGTVGDISVDLSRTTVVNAMSCDRVSIYGRGGAVIIESPVDGTAQLVRMNGASQNVTVTAGRNVYPVNATRGDIIIATFNGTTTKLQF